MYTSDALPVILGDVRITINRKLNNNNNNIFILPFIQRIFCGLYIVSLSQCVSHILTSNP